MSGFQDFLLLFLSLFPSPTSSCGEAASVRCFHRRSSENSPAVHLSGTFCEDQEFEENERRYIQVWKVRRFRAGQQSVTASLSRCCATICQGVCWVIITLCVDGIIVSVPLVNKEHSCPGQSGVGGVGQLAHSGVVYEASDEEHEA